MEDEYGDIGECSCPQCMCHYTRVSGHCGCGYVPDTEAEAIARAYLLRDTIGTCM